MSTVEAANDEISKKIARFERRIAENPRDINALNDLGTLLARAKRFDEAISLFKQASNLDPSHRMVWSNLAAAYEDTDKPEMAISCLEKVVAMDPGHATALQRLGRIRRKLKSYASAVEALEKAMALNPTSPQSHLDLAAALIDFKQEQRAREILEKAADIAADNADVHNNLGILLKEMGKHDEALKHLRKAADLRPQSASDRNNVGVALAEMGKYVEAIECYREAIKLDPRYAIAWNNLGNSQRSLGDDAAAIVSLRQALALKPDYAEAFNNSAIAYLHSGEIDRALENYNKAILLRPDYAEAHMNRALVWLALGDLKNGWSEYEWRWQLKTLRDKLLPGRRWDGSSLNGKRILIRYEQGLGDTFQFVRFLPMLKQRGAHVVFEGQQPVENILRRAGLFEEFVPRGGQLPSYDFYTTLLSLPGLFDVTQESIPASIPYLSPEPESSERWRARLSAMEGLKVGIAWQGNPQHRGDRQRSVRLEQFEVLAQVAGVRLISLQRGFGSEQVKELKGRFALETFEGVEEEGDGFLRTAAIVKNLDLVITVDTAIAHLAGAMGVPTWVALPMAADWRWLRDREDSPWYPTMRLFRKGKDQEWSSIFQSLSKELTHKVRESQAAANSVVQSLDPASAKELLRRGNRAVTAGEFGTAVELIEEAIAADPLNADVHHDYGVALAKQGNLIRAIVSFRRSIELKSDGALAYANLGLAFLQSDRIEEAIAHLRKAIHLGGGAADVHNNLGIALMRVPDPAAAIDCYVRALYLKPEYGAAHYNLSRALLQQGHFEQGWLEHEWRHDFFGNRRRSFRQTRWEGTPLAGRTLLVYAEQGLGDTIHFARYISLIKSQGEGQIIFESGPELRALMGRCEGVGRAIDRLKSDLRFDCHVPLLSLPAIFGTTLPTIPASIPYLSPEPESSERWRARLSAMEGLKVGIAWQGNPQHRGDRQRSVRLEQFEVLAQVAGVRLISLQRGFGSEQVKELKGRFALETFEGVEEEGDGFLRTAAIVKNLDLVITVDTAIAHLAGAMGVPTWVALPMAADWRWLRDREDSPWYPTMRLFRQHVRSNWGDVFYRIAIELAGYVSSFVQSALNVRRVDRPKIQKAAPQYPVRKAMSRGRINRSADNIAPSLFDVAVVVPTIIRPTLKRAIESIFNQDFAGRIQILIGIDKAVGDRRIVDELFTACPSNCEISVLDLGYSTSSRNGGLYPAMPGGALRTILSYAASSKRVAYLDDDNWFGTSHLQTLSDALEGNEWAYSLRWYTDRDSSEPLCVDEWESVGPNHGVYAQKLGGYVDPNCLLIDKIACESVLRWWCFPMPEDKRGISEDRQVFRLLKEYPLVGRTGLPTAYYVIRPDDDLHSHRMQWIASKK